MRCHAPGQDRRRRVDNQRAEGLEGDGKDIVGRRAAAGHLAGRRCDARLRALLRGPRPVIREDPLAKQGVLRVNADVDRRVVHRERILHTGRRPGSGGVHGEPQARVGAQPARHERIVRVRDARVDACAAVGVRVLGVGDRGEGAAAASAGLVAARPALVQQVVQIFRVGRKARQLCIGLAARALRGVGAEPVVAHCLLHRAFLGQPVRAALLAGPERAVLRRKRAEVHRLVGQHARGEHILVHLAGAVDVGARHVQGTRARRRGLVQLQVRRGMRPARGERVLVLFGREQAEAGVEQRLVYDALGLGLHRDFRARQKMQLGVVGGRVRLGQVRAERRVHIGLDAGVRRALARGSVVKGRVQKVLAVAHGLARVGKWHPLKDVVVAVAERRHRGVEAVVKPPQVGKAGFGRLQAEDGAGFDQGVFEVLLEDIVGVCAVLAKLGLAALRVAEDPLPVGVALELLGREEGHHAHARRGQVDAGHVHAQLVVDFRAGWPRADPAEHGLDEAGEARPAVALAQRQADVLGGLLEVHAVVPRVVHEQVARAGLHGDAVALRVRGVADVHEQPGKRGVVAHAERRDLDLVVERARRDGPGVHASVREVRAVEPEPADRQRAPPRVVLVLRTRVCPRALHAHRVRHEAEQRVVDVVLALVLAQGLRRRHHTVALRGGAGARHGSFRAREAEADRVADERLVRVGRAFFALVARGRRRVIALLGPRVVALVALARAAPQRAARLPGELGRAVAVGAKRVHARLAGDAILFVAAAPRANRAQLAPARGRDEAVARLARAGVKVQLRVLVKLKLPRRGREIVLGDF